MSRGILTRLVIVGLLALSACGKKGPPLAPLRVAPARVEDLTAAKTGDEVRTRFTIPAVNADQSKPADIVSVEVYAISGKAEDQFGQSLAGPQFVRFGDLVGRVEVAPVPKEGEQAPPDASAPVGERARAAAEAAAAARARRLPAQGETATVVEQLTDAARTPFVHPGRRRTPPAEDSATTAVPHILGPAPAIEPFSRTYVAFGVSRHGTRSSVSNRVAVPLADTPATPTGVAVTHDETSATITWTEPPGVWRRVQRPAIAGELEARSLAPGVVPTTYNVYRVVRGQGGADQVSPQPINPAPVEVATFTYSPIVLGEEGCFQVRTVRVYGAARLESAPSATACVRFADTFAPPAPANLAAVGSEGGVSLIWDPSPGSDVAGYLVLRGEIGPAGPPATLTVLTPEPIRETTFRDATAARGVRYVYAVVAVDGATPRNRSEESNRVEEGAR